MQNRRTSPVDQHLLEAFERCARENDADEVRMATLVARVLDPHVVPERVEGELEALALRRPAGQPPWEYLREAGFGGNVEDYAAIDNSNLAQVLETRRGIPITLAVVLIRMARHGGAAAAGLNFPGHFLVDVDDVIVDPFVMQPVSRESCLERLPPDARVLPADQIFRPASTLAMGLRMLGNVKLNYARLAVWDRALDIVDVQLRLTPHDAGLHLERGDLWMRLGLVAPARTSFETVLKLTASSPAEGAERMRLAAQSRLQDLGGASDVVH